MRQSLSGVALLCHLAACADDHAGHDHGAGKAFEWAGIFATPEDEYMWTAQKTESSSGAVKYVDPAMKLVALKVTSATEDALHAMEKEGEHALEMTCIEVEAGGTITPKEDTCYTLKFKQSWWQSLYTIDAKGADAIAFFTEHMPTEFENTAHYLKDDHGHDIEPVAELPEAAAKVTAVEDIPWGSSIAAAIIVNILTLIGVIFFLPVVARMSASKPDEFEGLISGFAAGALMACAFFLLLFESTHLIAVGYDTEVDTLWRWGVCIISGFLLPATIDNIVDAITRKVIVKQIVERPPEVIDVDVKQDEVGAIDAKLNPEMPGRVRVLSGVLIGDFFHNLVDGFFIGAAFQGCGSSFGWTVTLSTVIHEAAQEMADYTILTGSAVNLRPPIALLLNFLSGTSVLLGVIIVLASDIPQENTGMLLAFGGGVYLHIAATECMPKAYNPKLSPLMRVCCLLAFVIGAVAIGLVLLDHEHCIPKSADGEAVDPHAGHNH